MDSYPFPIYSGLLEPKHCKQIGTAIWLFLWCISATTTEKTRDGVTWGIVLGNKPMRMEELSETFGVHEKTVRRWVDTLEEHGYIQVTRAPKGLIFTVKNSKKYKDRMDKNVRSEESERTEMSEQSVSERTEMSDHRDKNVRSNKDITVDITMAAITITDPDEILRRAHEIEIYFLGKRGKGHALSSTDFEEVKKMITSGIPLEIVKTSIDKSFAEYKPKHDHDEIRNMSYCIPRCYDEWERSKVDESITSPGRPLPGSVALGSSKQMDKAAKFEKIAREFENDTAGSLKAF